MRRLATPPERYLVIDVETTGLSAADRVIELAAVKVERGNIVDTRTQLINPGRALTPFITGLTGITDDMLRSRASMETVLPAFLRFAEGLPVVGHNVSFDLTMLRHEGERLGIRVPLTIAGDTLVLARQRVPGLKSYSLGALVQQFRIECKPAHRALADVYATQALYRYLLALPEEAAAKQHKGWEACARGHV